MPGVGTPHPVEEAGAGALEHGAVVGGAAGVPDRLGHVAVHAVEAAAVAVQHLGDGLLGEQLLQRVVVAHVCPPGPVPAHAAGRAHRRGRRPLVPRYRDLDVSPARRGRGARGWRPASWSRG